MKNAGWLGLIQALNYLIPLLILPVVTRAFGPNLFGILSTFNAYGAYVAVIVGYGFELTGLRSISRSHVDTLKLSKIVFNIACAQFLLGVGAVVIFFAALPILPQGTEYKFVGLVVLIQMFVTAAIPQWVFIGLEHIRSLALVQFVVRALGGVLIVILINTPDDLLLYVSINCATAVAILVFSYIRLARYHIRWQTPELAELISVIRQASHLFFSSVSISLYTTTTVLIVALVLGPSAAGAFALADRVRVVAVGLIGPFTQAVYPFVYRMVGREQTREEAWTKRIFFRGVVVLSALISIILFIFAPLIILFLGGHAFQDAILVLRIIAFLPLIIALSNTFGYQTMIPLHMDRQFMWVVISAALLGITGVFALTNIFGLAGAALAMLAIEVYVTVAFVLLLQRQMSILSLFFER